MAGILGVLPRRALPFSIVVVVVSLALLAFSAGVVGAQQMVASWYGPGFEGATTASGEPFDPNDYTAAHRTLPFGTKLIVTYNGRSVVVRVNDRGPYVAGRDLDLSQAAAEQIGLTAVGEATVNVVTADPSTPTGPYGGSGGATQTQAPQQQIPTGGNTGGGANGGGAGGAQGGANAGQDQYAGRDQYAARDQYEQPEPAPVQAAAGPPPTPDPSRIEQPPKELATPGSTVERRIVIFLGATTEKPEPENTHNSSHTGSDSSRAKSVFGITELPDTGGVPLGALAGGALVATGAGLAARRLRL